MVRVAHVCAAQESSAQQQDGVKPYFRMRAGAAGKLAVQLTVGYI